MDKTSPWQTEPDAPGVLIEGTPPASLDAGSSVRTAQELAVALDRSRRDFPHVVREVIQRHLTAGVQEAELDEAERAIWAHVEARFRAAADGDAGALRAMLHPRFAGWTKEEPAPWDRDAAIADLVEGTIVFYELAPRRIEAYGQDLAVAHYAFASARRRGDRLEHVEGRRTDVFTRVEAAWLLVSSTGSDHPV